MAHASNRSTQPLVAEPEHSCTGGFAKLDFNNAKLGTNNLPTELEYTNVGTVDGKQVDVVISADSDYKPNGDKMPGLKGNLPFVIIQYQSSTKLTFTFKDSATKEQVTLCGFDFSVFDMDNPDDGQVQERITIGDFDQVFMADNQQYTTLKKKDGRSTYTAINRGQKCDNPKDAFDLKTVKDKKCVNGGDPIVQSERSIGFRYSEKSSIDLIFNVKCVERSGKCDKKKGRQLLFSFSSDMSPPAPTTTTTTPADIKKDKPQKDKPKPKPKKASGAPTMCFAKLEDFVGTNLNPDQDACKSGKNKLCLKEAVKADRCFK
jgi:hypothetical protein